MKTDLLNYIYDEHKKPHKTNWISNDLWYQFGALVSSSTVELLIYIVEEGLDLQNMCSFRSYTENLAAASQKTDMDVQKYFPVNTYPFGRKTNVDYPEFWAICSGKQSLTAVFNKALAYCQKPLEKDKTVVILTDKWDPAVFQKDYEMRFLHYALEQNVMFVFLLVTDYGITRIPFLSKDRGELNDIRGKGYEIEYNAPKPAVTSEQARSLLLEYDFCEFRRRNLQGDMKVYCFYFREKVCHIYDGIGNSKELKIPARALGKFARAVLPIYDLPDRDYYGQHHGQSEESYAADIFEKSFCWQKPDEMSEEHFGILSGAFEQLINSLGGEI